MGVERALLGMAPDVAAQPSIDVVLIPLGPQGWEACVSMARRFRERGLRVHWPTRPRPMGAQLRRVDRIGARYALFVGEGELAEGRFGLKDLRSGEQQSLDESAILRKIGERDG
jgi:histidyl-tRNA synthetase